MRLQVRARRNARAPNRTSRAAGRGAGWLRALTYDQLRLIEFGGANSLWLREGLPFQVQYLHPGFLFDRMVHLHEVKGGVATPIPFRREYFNYRDHYRTMKPGDVPDTMGFAGFRVMFPLDGPRARPSEVGSFAGASYFRFLPRGAAYGLSARGLALNTWEPEGEEFPTFTEFWLEQPAPGGERVGEPLRAARKRERHGRVSLHRDARRGDHGAHGEGDDFTAAKTPRSSASRRSRACSGTRRIPT